VLIVLYNYTYQTTTKTSMELSCVDARDVYR